MGVKFKYTTKTDKLTEMVTRLESLKDRKVKVGCLNGDHAWLAGIHEYG